MMPPEIAELFERLQGMPDASPIEKLRKMPPGKIIADTAFFPGGTGLWHAPTNQYFPHHGVMVQGNTWDTRAAFDDALTNGSLLKVFPDGRPDLRNAAPTERNLIPFLQTAGIELTDCWFTNVYPGLIENPGSSSNTGSANIKRGGRLEQFCQCFFLHTVKLMQPRLLLALGREPVKFVGRLAKISSWQKMQTFGAIDDAGDASVDVNLAGVPITAVALVHPCMRAGNVRHRHLPSGGNDDVEVALLRQAVIHATATGTL